MKRLGLWPAVVILIGAPASAASPATIIGIERSTIRVYTTAPCAPRTGSGFLYPDASHVVTALHVVGDCVSLGVSYAETNGSTAFQQDRSAKTVKVLKSADLALVEVLGSPPAGHRALHVDPVCPLQRQGTRVGCLFKAWYTMYGYEGRHPSPADVQANCCLTNTLQEVFGLDQSSLDDIRSLRALGFPALNGKVLPFLSPILYGDSGGPIVDDSGNVVGIADGGFGQPGMLVRGWGIPSSYVPALLSSHVSVGPELASLPALFRSEVVADAPNSLTFFVRGHALGVPAFPVHGKVFIDAVRNGAIDPQVAALFQTAFRSMLIFDPAQSAIQASAPGAEITLFVGKHTVVLNGESRPLEDPPLRYHNDVMVPLPVESDVFGGGPVLWDPDRMHAVLYADQFCSASFDYSGDPAKRRTFRGGGAAWKETFEDGHTIALTSGLVTNGGERAGIGDIYADGYYLVDGNLGVLLLRMSGNTEQFFFIPLQYSEGTNPLWIRTLVPPSKTVPHDGYGRIDFTRSTQKFHWVLYQKIDRYSGSC